ncbi:hypothetical protein D3C81_1772270 [compost metagenome]
MPTALVVKNGSKMRDRCSGAMPPPVSSTSIHTSVALSLPVRRVMRPRSSFMAWAALTTRFMITWFSSEGWHSISGMSPYSRTTSALYLTSLFTILSVVSMPWRRSAQTHSWCASVREKSFRSCTMRRTREMPSFDSPISMGMSVRRKSRSICSRSARRRAATTGSATAGSASS